MQFPRSKVRTADEAGSSETTTSTPNTATPARTPRRTTPTVGLRDAGAWPLPFPRCKGALTIATAVPQNRLCYGKSSLLSTFPPSSYFRNFWHESSKVCFIKSILLGQDPEDRIFDLFGRSGLWPGLGLSQPPLLRWSERQGQPRRAGESVDRTRRSEGEPGTTHISPASFCLHSSSEGPELPPQLWGTACASGGNRPSSRTTCSRGTIPASPEIPLTPQ